jgi:ATP-dependent RNA helicase RhlE
VPFTSLKLHPNLLKGIKELGFVRPTPIQADAIPPGLDGQDVLACAMTGSDKTAAFLLPILHRLINKPRGTTRALVLTPTRELAAQILEDLNDLAVHTPITTPAVFGGVGMSPQEHALRSGDTHRGPDRRGSREEGGGPHPSRGQGEAAGGRGRPRSNP